jgi:hypothetical protein
MKVWEQDNKERLSTRLKLGRTRKCRQVQFAATAVICCNWLQLAASISHQGNGGNEEIG